MTDLPPELSAGDVSFAKPIESYRLEIVNGIDLGGDKVPCEMIAVEVEDAEFARDYYVEAGATR